MGLMAVYLKGFQLFSTFGHALMRSYTLFLKIGDLVLCLHEKTKLKIDDWARGDSSWNWIPLTCRECWAKQYSVSTHLALILTQFMTNLTQPQMLDSSHSTHDELNSTPNELNLNPLNSYKFDKEGSGRFFFVCEITEV